MVKKVISFGELMMRLKTPDLQRFSQANSFEFCFGGGEANVAVSLAWLGYDSKLVTALPDNLLGQRALAELRHHNVNTEFVNQSDDGRLGLYFMEQGANQRSGQVVYDRSGSSFANMEPKDIDWKSVFDGADWFHMSGISPAIGQNSADLSLLAVKQAKEAGVKVSLDLNHRSKLWQYDVEPAEIMREMIMSCDILIAGREDCQKCIDIKGEGDPDSTEYFKSLTKNVMKTFPHLEAVAVTIRDTKSAEHHNWAACIRTQNDMLFSSKYKIKDIVDRVGTGDAFAAGLIYGMCEKMDSKDALEFAAAANCLKHSIEGDFNMATVEDVLLVRDGDGTGRVQR